jgi:serine/threonine protein kinase
MDVLTGRKLGPYEIHELLGRGGMGAVYRAVHETLEQSRAIKVLPAHFSGDPDFVERFRREAAIAAKLHHPNVVQIYDIGERDGLHYIIMQFVEGRSLRDVIRTESPLSTRRASYILRQLAEAVDYAHARGVVHRDLKPGNILVQSNDHVTLVDFGIARAANEVRLTRTGLMVGTPEYMAPEVVTGSGEGPSADLYALGVVAYELLTGTVPFGGTDTPAVMFAHVHRDVPSPREFRDDLPRSIETALLRQLRKAPADRYPSAGSFVAALEDDSTVDGRSVWGTVINLSAEPITPLGGPTTGGQTAPGGSSAMRPISSPTARRGTAVTTITPPPMTQARPAQGSFAPRSIADEIPTPTPAPRSRTEVAQPAGSQRTFVVSMVAIGLALVAIGALAAQQLGLLGVQQVAAPIAAQTAVASATAVPPTVAPTVAPATPIPTLAPTLLPTLVPTIAPTLPPTAVVQAPAPPSPQERLQNARSALDAGNFGTAIEQLRALRQSDPGTAGLDDALYDAHVRFGGVLSSQNNFDAAAAQYQEALGIRPGDGTAAEGLKQVGLARDWATMEASWGGDDERAIQALESIMGADPGYRDTRQKLYALLVAKADRLLVAGERDAAVAALNRALEVNPEGGEARQRLVSLTPTPMPTPVPAPVYNAPQPAPKTAPQPAPAKSAPAPAPAKSAPAPAQPAQTNPAPAAPSTGGTNKPFQP